MRELSNPPYPDDRFGKSVAVSDDSVYIGAPHNNDSTTPTVSGTAYVYTVSSGHWRTINAVTSSGSDKQAGAEFGDSVSLSGDTLVVGSPLYDVSSDTYAAGAAYVYSATTGQYLDRKSTRLNSSH